jgi:hypothetical protein
MNYFDPRLSKILSDIRLEQAESIRRRKSDNPASKMSYKERLGLFLIAQGERLAQRKPKVA